MTGTVHGQYNINYSALFKDTGNVGRYVCREYGIILGPVHVYIGNVVDNKLRLSDHCELMGTIAIMSCY